MTDKAVSSEESLVSAFDSTLPFATLENLTTVVAVSGGPDSVALTHLVVRHAPPKARIVVAHFNHQFRGDQSDQDEAFVKSLAEELGCEFRLGSAETTEQTETDDSNNGQPPSHSGQGLEALARQSRYQFLEQTVAETGARLLLTAHTLDDQVETVVYRLFRGSGIRGLCGIQPIRQWMPGVSLVRPFLHCSKDLIVKFLEENQLPFRIDETNRSGMFSRNRIRNELLPLVQDIFSHPIDSPIVSLVENCIEYQQWVDPQTDKLVERFVTFDKHQVNVQLENGLLHEPLILLAELWTKIWTKMGWPQQQMSRSKWKLLTQLATQNTSATKINLPGDIFAERRSDCLIIEAASAKQIRSDQN